MRSMLLALVVLTTPLAVQAQQRYVPGIRVNVAPPTPRMESPSRAPSTRHQWISGYWGRAGNAFVWHPGWWAIPPALNYIWEPAAWEQQGGVWVFYEGHWRTSEQPNPVTVYQPPPPSVQPELAESAPPPAYQEVQPPMPFEGSVWVPGYWVWGGNRYVWVAGRWSAQPAGYVWEHHKWRHREDGKWEHRPGHWHPRDEDEDHHGDERRHDEDRGEGHRH